MASLRIPTRRLRSGRRSGRDTALINSRNASLPGGKRTDFWRACLQGTGLLPHCRNDAWLASIAQPALPAYTATIAGGRLALALASLGAAASLALGAGSNLRLRGGHSRAPSMAPMPPPPAPAANVPRLQTAAGPDFGDGAFQPNDMVRVLACLAAVAARKLTRLTNRSRYMV